jgi:hypothetical protein
MSLWIAETWLRKSGFTYSLSFGEDTDLMGTADERLAYGEEYGDGGEDYEMKTTRESVAQIWDNLLPTWSGGGH